jgi:two-component system response regulator ResD
MALKRGAYMINILLADDDTRIRTIVREYSQAEDWNFIEAENGEDALSKFNSENITLIVLDIMMPKLDGWSVLKKIRQTSQMPVIMLTARNEEYDRLLGFELGVDDYIGKPFSPRELIARIKALLKRAGAAAAATQTFTYESLNVDLSAHVVKISNDIIALTPKEFDLLAFLVSRPGIVFTRDQLLNHVWGYDYYGDARTVDTHIKSLREKLGIYRDLIATVWGTGYRFDGGSR